MFSACRLLALGLVLSLGTASPVDPVYDLDASLEMGLETRQTTTSCSKDFHLMVAAGCKVPCASDEPDLLGGLLRSIKTRWPHSDQYLVPYNGSLTQGKTSTPVMIQAVYDYARVCPSTPIFFVGYSLGGIIIMNTLCGGVSSNLTTNVIGAVLYGEETYVGGQSYDKSTCKANAPLYPRNTTALCAPYAPVIHSYCLAQDSACCSTGTQPQAHYDYGKVYNFAAMQYIAAQSMSYHRAHPTAAPRAIRG